MSHILAVFDIGPPLDSLGNPQIIGEIRYTSGATRYVHPLDIDQEILLELSKVVQSLSNVSFGLAMPNARLLYKDSKLKLTSKIVLEERSAEILLFSAVTIIAILLMNC